MTKAVLLAAASAFAVAGAALIGCPKAMSTTAATTDAQRDSESSVVVWIVRAAGREASAAAVQSTSGALRILHAPDAPDASMLARLGSASAVRKIASLVALLDRIEASRESDPALRVYLQVDPERTTRERLAAAGFEVDTLAVDVATGRVRLSALERVLASDMVRHLELPRAVHLR